MASIGDFVRPFAVVAIVPRVSVLNFELCFVPGYFATRYFAKGFFGCFDVRVVLANVGAKLVVAVGRE